jgi:hypothetical protein
MLVAMREHNGITFYGYRYGSDFTPYWSMRYYPEMDLDNFKFRYLEGLV